MLTQLPKWTPAAISTRSKPKRAASTNCSRRLRPGSSTIGIAILSWAISIVPSWPRAATPAMMRMASAGVCRRRDVRTTPYRCGCPMRLLVQLPGAARADHAWS